VLSQFAGSEAAFANRKLVGMLEAGRRKRNQPAPPDVIFEPLTQPNRDPDRLWLKLLDDEVNPDILESESPMFVAWSWLWIKRPDARIRFELPPDASGYGTDLCWTLASMRRCQTMSCPAISGKRVNEPIDRDLRLPFGQ
jgi:hypothetical protein